MKSVNAVSPHKRGRVVRWACKPTISDVPACVARRHWYLISIANNGCLAPVDKSHGISRLGLGSLDIGFEDGLKLVKLRGEAMQAAADAAKSAMVSIIGLDSEKVQQLCDAANQEVDEADKVQIANYLCPGNYAVSGGLKGIEVVRLAVAAAFHTSFMEPAVSRLEAALAETEIRSPRIPVISNVDAQPHADPDTIKKILARQVTSPVQWETTVKTLLSKGIKSSYELGPGKVIAGIFKRVDKSATVENISA
ncbi:unnamed protein product [Brassica rapa subsp. narinosa]